MKTITLFHCRSGVGKSFLAYHLAYMFQRLGLRVAVADIDPQTHLTGAFFDEQTSEELALAHPRKTIVGALETALQSPGNTLTTLENINDLHILAGDRTLAAWEDRFSRAWYDILSDRMDRVDEALSLTRAFHSIARNIEHTYSIDVLLFDLGPSLGAINRAALLATDAIVVPTTPDAASRSALLTLGQTIRDWRQQWLERRDYLITRCSDLPMGTLSVMGYVVLQLPIDIHRDMTRAHNERAVAQAFHESILGDNAPQGQDLANLAWLRHLRGLQNLHLEARKPVFDLKAADGAIGSYAVAVQDARVAFDQLAREIAKRLGLVVPL